MSGDFLMPFRFFGMLKYAVCGNGRKAKLLLPEVLMILSKEILWRDGIFPGEDVVFSHDDTS